MPPEQSINGGRMRALVVDDVPEICNMYKMLFHRIRGVETELVVETNSAVAVQLLREGSYDLVVSDFRMREADGVEVLRAAYERNPRGRRVLMTGYNEIPTSIERIRSAHIDAYIQKPLKMQDVLIMLTQLLVGDEASIRAYRERAGAMEEIAMREEQDESGRIAVAPAPARTASRTGG